MRRTLAIVFCLAVGTAANVVVAWVAIIWAPASVVDSERIEALAPSAWRQPASDPPRRTWQRAREGFGCTILTRGGYVHDGGECGSGRMPETNEWFVRSGWPARSFEGSCKGSGSPFPHGQLRAATPIPLVLSVKWRAQWGRLLPFGPRLPHLVANTAMYSVATWILLYVVTTAKRQIRLRSGRCPACGYTVGGSPVCTECGRRLPKEAVAVA